MDAHSRAAAPAPPGALPTAPIPASIVGAPIPEPIAPPSARGEAPPKLPERDNNNSAQQARADRLQGPPAPAPPGGGGGGGMTSRSPNPTRPGGIAGLPRNSFSGTTANDNSNNMDPKGYERASSQVFVSPRSGTITAADKSGSKIRKKFAKIGKKKDKDYEGRSSLTESQSFESDMGKIMGSSFAKDEFGRYSIVTEEEMYMEKDRSKFYVYVACEERPGCFYECTFHDPLTIAKLVGELCVEFLMGLGKNLSVYRMHIMSPGDTPESNMTSLGPAHKSDPEGPTPTTPTTSPPPGNLSSSSGIPMGLPMGRLDGPPAPLPPALGEKPSAPPTLPPLPRNNFPEGAAGSCNSARGEGADTGRKSWQSALRSGSTPFVLHTSMHIRVDEIEKVMDERDQVYRFVMMKPQVSQKADLLDIYKDDEWEGSHEHYFWGPLMIEEIPETVVDLDSEKKGWRLEPGGNRKIMVSSTMQQLNPEPGIPRIPLYLVSSPYASFFYNKGQDNYWAESEGCPIFISVEKPSEESKSQLKMLVRDISGDVRSRTMSSNPKEISKVLANIRPNLAGLKLKKIVTDAAVQKALFDFETHTQLPRKMKFGVLCIKPGQVIDDEFFANKNGGHYYEEFLDFIGDKIKLQGWDKYRGGLDVQKDSTGEYGLYTTFSEVEIMFHVSTMLPFDAADTQHLERKRHLGNDVACIAFMDPEGQGTQGGLVFNPLTIASHFIHVWVVVSVNMELTRERGKTHYQIEVVNKAGVRPFEPFLTGEPLEKNEKTRKVILTKLVNGEITALAAPQFMHTDRRTRTQLLQEMAKEIQTKS